VTVGDATRATVSPLPLADDRSSADDRDFPSRTDAIGAALSQTVGGPVGRHALIGRARLLTPVRVTAWWNGRRYPVWMGYIERYPQAWPELPQWGFSQIVATDAVACASVANM
jgi:hypothetical protein